MTEQEYCDLSDLQLCRATLTIMRSMNCFDDPNKTLYESIIDNLRLMVKNLEPKIPELTDNDV